MSVRVSRVGHNPSLAPERRQIASHRSPSVAQAGDGRCRARTSDLLLVRRHGGRLTIDTTNPILRHLGTEKCATSVATDAAETLARSTIEIEEVGKEVRSAMEWAQVRAMDADGIPPADRQAARDQPRTVKRLAEASEPPSYRRKPAGSMLDPLEPVIRKLLDEWPEIKAPRVTELLRDEHGYRARSTWSASGWPRCDRQRAPGPANRLPARPGDAGRLGRDADPAEDLRPRAPHLRPDLLAALLGRLDRPLLLRDDGRVVPRGPRPRLRVARRRPARVRLRQPALGGRPPRGRPDHLEPALHRSCAATTPSTPPPARPRPRARRARSRARSATPRRGFWPARRFDSLAELDRQLRRLARADTRCPRRHSAATSSSPTGSRSSAMRRGRCRRRRFDYAGRRTSRVPLDGYLKHRASFYRAPEALVHRRVELRFDRDRVWIDPPRRRPSPATSAATSPGSLAARRRGCGPSRRRRSSAPRSRCPRSHRPELADYAELCA